MAPSPGFPSHSKKAHSAYKGLQALTRVVEGLGSQRGHGDNSEIDQKQEDFTRYRMKGGLGLQDPRSQGLG